MKFNIKEGEIYFPKKAFARHNHRRVISIINGVVFYSVGGDKNYSCKIKTFKKAVTAPKEAA